MGNIVERQVPAGVRQRSISADIATNTASGGKSNAVAARIPAELVRGPEFL
jgi:hypothetical protein